MCLAELYIANRTGALCSNETMFICANNDGPSLQWIITTLGGTTRTLGFHLSLHSEGAVMSRTIESTPVTAELIFANSSYYVTSLTIVATLSATIYCSQKSITYQPESGKPYRGTNYFKA